MELGGGTGYGAALASEVVGEGGQVLSLEVEPSLEERAQRNLAGYAQTRYRVADAHDVSLWQGAQKVYVAFAIKELPELWAEALDVGGRLVAPVGNGGGAQTLTLFEKTGGGITSRELGAVIYVPDRTVLQRQHPTT